MTDQKKEFLRLCIVQQRSYKEISEQLGVPQKTLSDWYEELREEREKIAKIRTIWTRKKIAPELLGNKHIFEKFYNEYIKFERKCEYCGITEDEIKKLLDEEQLYTKRIATRGRALELDRKIPDLGYNETDNLVLCCYWCNNAKTDTFSYEEFKQIGEVFSKIWKKRLENLHKI